MVNPVKLFYYCLIKESDREIRIQKKADEPARNQSNIEVL